MRHDRLGSESLDLQGVIPPLATPLIDDETLDEKGLERLLQHVLEGGVHGLFVLGTTGEGPSVPYRLRQQLIEQTCQIAASRSPVLVGVSDTSLMESVQLAEAAYGAGASAVVIAPPFYLPLEPVQVEDHIQRFADRSPLPVVLYNIPSCTRNEFDLLSVQRCRDHANIIGIKDSSGDMDFFADLLNAFRDDPDFRVLIGPEEQLGRAVLAGAAGGVCGGANLFPELFVAIYEAAAAGDQTRAEALTKLSNQLADEVYRVGPFWPSSIIQGIKSGLEVLQIATRFTATPIKPLDDQQTDQIRSALNRLSPQLLEQLS